jgi:hypothetical protein
VINAIKHNITAYVGGALTYPGPRVTFRCDMCEKCFGPMDVRHPQYLGTAPMNQSIEVARAQGGERALED